MERDDVLGVFPEATREQVNALLNLRGREVNESKSVIEDLRTQLAAANSRIEEFDKAKQEQMTREEKLDALIKEAEQQKRDNAIERNRLKAEAVLSGIGITGDAASAQLDILVSEDMDATIARATALADLIAAQREETKSATEKSLLANMGHPEGAGAKGDVTKDEFAKMTYMQKLELKQNDPDLFKKLSS